MDGIHSFYSAGSGRWDQSRRESLVLSAIAPNFGDQRIAFLQTEPQEAKDHSR